MGEKAWSCLFNVSNVIKPQIGLLISHRRLRKQISLPFFESSILQLTNSLSADKNPRLAKICILETMLLSTKKRNGFNSGDFTFLASERIKSSVYAESTDLLQVFSSSKCSVLASQRSHCGFAAREPSISFSPSVAQLAEHNA